MELGKYFTLLAFIVYYTYIIHIEASFDHYSIYGIIITLSCTGCVTGNGTNSLTCWWSDFLIQMKLADWLIAVSFKGWTPLQVIQDILVVDLQPLLLPLIISLLLQGSAGTQLFSKSCTSWWSIISIWLAMHVITDGFKNIDQITLTLSMWRIQKSKGQHWRML